MIESYFSGENLIIWHKCTNDQGPRKLLCNVPILRSLNLRAASWDCWFLGTSSLLHRQNRPIAPLFTILEEKALRPTPLEICKVYWSLWNKAVYHIMSYFPKSHLPKRIWKSCKKLPTVVSDILSTADFVPKNRSTLPGKRGTAAHQHLWSVVQVLRHKKVGLLLVIVSELDPVTLSNQRGLMQLNADSLCGTWNFVWYLLVLIVKFLLTFKKEKDCRVSFFSCFG
jgi:hypothetical protein